MEKQILVYMLLILLGGMFGLVLLGFFHGFFEPVFIYFFKRPVFVYFHPIPSKLSHTGQLILRNKISFYNKLSKKKKIYFEHRVAQFLRTYDFVPKDGLELTEEMRIRIASIYIMLTFGMRNYLIEVFDKIIVYPDSYPSGADGDYHNGEFNLRAKAIVFSWKHFESGYMRESDNLNLGIHEFTHALHYNSVSRPNESDALFLIRYEEILKEARDPSQMDQFKISGYFRDYAFTNDFEFLAVILEHFFETPQSFNRQFPELFQKVRQMINYTPPEVSAK